MTIEEMDTHFHDTLFSTPNSFVYAVLDGASIPEMLTQFTRFQADYICLYRGDLSTEMAKVAPYLVALPPNSDITNWLLSLVGKHPGIFARTTAPMREMRQHLRKFLMVYDPESNPVYFRYYDPRVLRTHLPQCNADETKTIFGPISHYFAENEAGNQLLSFTP